MDAKQLRGLVEIDIEGEQRFLRYHQAAVRELMDKLSLDTLPELAKRMSTVDAEVVHACIWAGLLHEEEPPTYEEVGEYFYPMIPAVNAITQAINLALFGNPNGMQAKKGGSDDVDDPSRKSLRKKKRSKGSAKGSGSPPHDSASPRINSGL